jgi:hypothetical protein
MRLHFGFGYLWLVYEKSFQFFREPTVPRTPPFLEPDTAVSTGNPGKLL